MVRFNVARSGDEMGTFFGSGDVEASFSKNLGSEASAEASFSKNLGSEASAIYIYNFAFIFKANIPNTKLGVEDMKTCIFLHKS